MDAVTIVIVAAFWLAVHLTACAIWILITAKEKGMPPPVCPQDCLSWKRGDTLASARDWWRWQFITWDVIMLAMGLTVVTRVLDITHISGIVLIGAGLFWLGIFLYFGAQRLIAAGKNGLWIFPMPVLGWAAHEIEPFVFLGMVSIAILIYVGTLRDKEPRAGNTA
ncbi:MAG: hypothetical protein ACR2P4_04065 [Gammaproteobacteria bacterium]